MAGNNGRRRRTAAHGAHVRGHAAAGAHVASAGWGVGRPAASSAVPPVPPAPPRAPVPSGVASPPRKPFAHVVDVTDVARRQHGLRRQLIALRAFTVLLLLAAIGVGGFPVALQYQSQIRLAETAQEAENHVLGWPYPQAELAFEAAQAYNRKLAQDGQPVMGEAVDPFKSVAGHSTASGGDDSAASKDTEYQSLLDTGNGVMGSIVVPKVSIDLPIYHGTSEEALAAGSGHLYGSSLPVGGADTHAVLTGHRGLVEALMFTRLDEMEVGDFFYVKVMGETLGYRVDRITVIEPDDVSQLKIVPGEDRVTLMTCTPYGVNTHRLLVSGTRQAIPNPIPQIKDAPKDSRLWTAVATGVPLVAGLVTLAARHRPWRRMRHAAPLRPRGPHRPRRA
ncbi:sortase family protein [Bifidobacterium sp. DSM 109958]|uniref:Sortase family protein n=1 Tax=Bifidobacterium moraviense TaxID=2675323 RepID=A0A7Y0F3F3_9BIFI|nr:class C sortase [Bifidobacterium sp. DSM 109958]NMN01226.1 sortase family protein [Bifidobacterium sp. DSM 109958]